MVEVGGEKLWLQWVSSLFFAASEYQILCLLLWVLVGP